jgi:hypothetical protein
MLSATATHCPMPEPIPAPLPWYRERWPWLLIAGPAIVVVAGITTAVIAIRSDDGLVAADYYKRGLLINKEIERSQRAETMHLGAVLRAQPDGRVAVVLSTTDAAAPAPAELRLRLARPTTAGKDVALTLPRAGDGSYQGRIGEVQPGRWLVTIESDAWQLPTVAVADLLAEVRIGTAQAAR